MPGLLFPSKATDFAIAVTADAPASRRSWRDDQEQVGVPRLKRLAARHEINDDDDNRDYQQYVDQSARSMEHNKPKQPENH